MTALTKTAGAIAARPWRVARWSAAIVLLCVPLAMMQISDEWRWTAGDFIVAGIMIGGSLFLYELIASSSGGRAYRAGVALALATCLCSIWTVFVRDDGTGAGYFMVVLAAAVGAFTAGFRAAGMARAALGVAVMQMMLALLIATAPFTARLPRGATRPLVAGAFFAILWLATAALFRAAARSEPRD